jgi:transposase
MDWKKLLTYSARSVNEELRLRNAYLAAENRILRHQLHGRVSLTDAERTTLAVLGQQLGKKALEEIATVAKPETILAWHRKLVVQPCANTQPPPSMGRPRIDKELEDLVVRMARENRSWGYDRIVGALLNLGYRISDQTVGNILKRHGIPPAPERKKTTTWREFIRIHMDVLIATDFFTMQVWSWFGLVSCFLCFRPLSRRQGHEAGVALPSHTRWMLLLLARLLQWYADTKRWLCMVKEAGLRRRSPAGDCIRQPLLCVVATPHGRAHYSRGRDNVLCLPSIPRKPIRDGPVRHRWQRGGLTYDRRAAA